MIWSRQIALWGGLWFLILLPRLWILGTQPISEMPHGELERSAACLAANRFLGDPYPGYGEPSAHVAPLYPAFLAVIYAMLGCGYSGHLCQAIVTIGLMGTAISLLPRLSRYVYGFSSPGWIAAVLMSFLPLSIGFIQVWGIWEQHCSFLATVLYLPLLIGVHRQQWRNPHVGIILGAATGITTLLNPQFALVFAFFLIVEFVVQQQRHRLSQQIAIASAIAVLIVVPWEIRNYQVLGGFCPIRSNAGLELALGNNDQSNGRTFLPNDPNLQPSDPRHPDTSPDELAAIKSQGELRYMKQKQQDALTWIREHPVRWSELTLTRIYLFWLPPQTCG